MKNAQRIRGRQAILVAFLTFLTAHQGEQQGCNKSWQQGSQRPKYGGSG